MLYRPGQVPPTNAPVHADQIISPPGALPFPLEGRLVQTGESVTLLQTCNWQGNSPATIGIVGGKFILATLDEVSELKRAVV